ncbi:jg2013 [Pararge aegeria aegeria]|uniref:Jg2013 protein n=1 Tax=Pararge aegeria aegeria TaxID=348720 RepID=A0A8S4S9C5_9NEOP|nr:jg2013 [Pararge aegeria aegeria]
MGGCIGITRSRSGPIEDSSGTVSRPNSGGLRKNQSLCHETIRWKSDVPLTEGQLRSKRDEFWDTAPAFEGRKEIWDALRAAAVAAEATDFQLAQAILDGASVSVPNGYLTECYDEWGTRYQVPIYCLSAPLNMVKEAGGRDSPAECSEPALRRTSRRRGGAHHARLRGAGHRGRRGAAPAQLVAGTCARRCGARNVGEEARIGTRSGNGGRQAGSIAVHATYVEEDFDIVRTQDRVD